jgi:hypothetical protein
MNAIWCTTESIAQKSRGKREEKMKSLSEKSQENREINKECEIAQRSKKYPQITTKKLTTAHDFGL